MHNLSLLILFSVSMPTMHAMNPDTSKCDDLFTQPSTWGQRLQEPDQVSWFRQLYTCAQKYPDRMEATLEQHFSEHPDAMAKTLIMTRAKGFTFTKPFLEKIDKRITDVIEAEQHEAIKPHMCNLKNKIHVMLQSRNYRSYYQQ